MNTIIQTSQSVPKPTVSSSERPDYKKAEEAFKSLLDVAISGTDLPAKTKEIKTEKKQQNDTNSTKKDETNPAAMADAGVQATPQQTPVSSEGEATAESETVAVNAQQTSAQPVQLATAADELIKAQSEQQMPTGNILSVEVETIETAVADGANQLPVEVAAQPEQVQDKLSTMLDEAQKQLNQMQQVQSPDTEATVETGNITAPQAEADDASTVQAKTDDTFVEAEAETVSVKEAPATRVQTTAQQKPTEQTPVSQLTKSDRAVMDMQEPVRKTEKPQIKGENENAVAAVQQTEVKSEQLQQTAKVAQPQREVHRSDAMEQVRIQLDKNIENQKMEFRMQLQPQELGKVDVKMVLEGGRLAVEIIAANSKTAEILQRQVDGLVHSLKLSNMDVQSVSVIAQSENASGEMQGAFNMMHQSTYEGDQTSQSGQSGSSKTQDEMQTQQDSTDAKDSAQPERLLNYAV